MISVKVRCTRPLLFEGKAYAAGAEIPLAAAAAGEAIASGRAVLANRADGARVQAGT
jgi:hypothetical protein